VRGAPDKPVRYPIQLKSSPLSPEQLSRRQQRRPRSFTMANSDSNLARLVVSYQNRSVGFALPVEIPAEIERVQRESEVVLRVEFLRAKELNDPSILK